MSSLFEIPESKSPRLQWIEKHGIWTKKVEYDHAGPTEPEELWMADAAGFEGRGPDEDSAIVALAKQMGIKLWNE